MEKFMNPRSGAHQILRCAVRALCIGGLFGSVSLVVPASAQTQTATSANAQSGGELQEIVVTGSMIKRTDSETPAPVQILTNLDLQNSGYTNVVDVLRNLSANGSGTLNQGFGQAFAAGEWNRIARLDGGRHADAHRRRAHGVVSVER
jgi:outer membrane receptor protein involved in Fe transport